MPGPRRGAGGPRAWLLLSSMVTVPHHAMSRAHHPKAYRASLGPRPLCPSGSRTRPAARPQQELILTTKCTFSQQLIFYQFFLNEDGRILKNGLSKLLYQFRRYSILTKTVLLESQYLQSYDSLPDFLRPKFEEDRHNFAHMRFKQNCLGQS